MPEGVAHKKFEHIGLFLLQVVLLGVVFGELLYAGDMFSNTYDGLKGYFGFISHALSIGGEGIFLHSKGLHYPFGELVIFTDGTPLLAHLFQQIHKVWPIESHLVTLFNVSILAFIPLASVYWLKAFRVVGRSTWVTFFAALVLPWLSPMFLRLGIGHFNLSISFFLVYALYTCLLVFEGKRSSLFFYTQLVLMMLFAASFHLYYLGLMGFIYIGFGAVWFLYQWFKTKTISIKSIALVVFPIIALVCMKVFIGQLDTVADERLLGSSGYDWEPWNFRLESLFKSDDQLSGFSLFSYGHPYWHTYEQYGFLGHSFWFGLPLIAWYLYDNKPTLSKVWWFIPLLMVGLIALITSLGETAQIGSIRFDNWLNPFYYLSRITEQVKQFRCLARFSWIFFMSIHFLFWFGLSKIWTSASKYRLLVLVPVLVAAVEVIFIAKTATDFRRENLFAKSKFKELPFDYGKFQAILPIPYYHSGSDVKGLTIDPVDAWYQKTTALSIQTKLPMMAAKMGRSSTVQVSDLFDFMLGAPSENIEALLEAEKKSILIVFSKDETHFEEHRAAPAKVLSEDIKTWIEDKEVDLLHEDESVIFYSWNKYE